MGFETFLRLLTEKTPVRAGAVNKPLREIDQNVRYLWDVLQAAGIGSTVYAHRQTVEPEVEQGMAVYFNDVTQRFERGLAQASVDLASGIIETSPTAHTWGIVEKKLSANLAEILLFGVTECDISAAVDGAVEPGVYYLSGTMQGKLVRQKPPVSVPVLTVIPGGKIFVQAQFVDVLDRHTHYRFDLACQPAGDTHQPAPGQRHVVTAGDSALRGWLPADDPSFEGHAPPGAAFGYNLKAAPALLNAWPPVPFNNAYLEWDKGEDPSVGAFGVPLGKEGLAVLDRYGIWWMSDCYGDVPWALDYHTGVSDSFSGSVDATCPRHLDMRVTLWFTKLTFATDLSAVLSLHSNDRRIKVLCYGTETPASVGHLTLELDLNLTVVNDQDGYLALKEFDGDTSEFKRGPVVEGVYARSGNVTLNGDVKKTRTIGGTDFNVYQGLVGVSVQPQETLEVDVQLARLDGCEEEHFDDLMYLAFRPAVQEAYRAKIHIPDNLSLASPKMVLRFAVLGRISGTLPQLTFSYRRLARAPDGLVTPEPLPTTDTALACDTTGTLTDTNQYVEAESVAFDVAPGDTVFFTVERLATDGYNAEVGILRQTGVLSSGA